jgi:uncharacterized membrane protein
VSMGFVLLLTFGIGLVSGLRTFSGVAAVTWAAHLGWINLSGSPLAFMGSRWALVLFSILALAEYVFDQLPSTPARTIPTQVIARLVTGTLSGACLAVTGGISILMGVIAAVVGILVGTYGGYHTRVGLVRSLKVPDIAVGVPEDLIAICLGLFIVSRF